MAIIAKTTVEGHVSEYKIDRRETDILASTNASQ